MLLEVQGGLCKEIYKSIRAGQNPKRMYMLIDKLNPMARHVFRQHLMDQRARLEQRENDPTGARPPPELPPAPEQTWSPHPREKHIELLNNLDELLIV